MAMGEPQITCGPARAALETGGLFDVDVAIVTAQVGAHMERLFPAERLVIASAAPARRAEFASGRHCARSALAQLGIPPTAIPSGPSREPLWPEDTVGSISHSGSTCLAVAALRSRGYAGIGVDIEQAGELDETLLDIICTPDEMRAMGAMSRQQARAHAKILFSIKESVFKCQFPMTGVWLEFTNVEVDIGPDARSYEAALKRQAGPLRQGYRIGGKVRATADFVVSSAWLRSEPPAARQ